MSDHLSAPSALAYLLMDGKALHAGGSADECAGVHGGVRAGGHSDRRLGEYPDGPAGEEGIRTLALTLAYCGESYAGFARQPKQTTVQGELEAALAVIFRREIATTCAGRTDSGVHALGQVVSFDVSEAELAERPLPRLMRSLNAITPDDIAIRGIREEQPGFSARFDARSREYRYRIVTGEVPPVFLERFAWWLRAEPQLDVEAMCAAAACLIGEHDFKSFCVTASAEGKPTCRNVHTVDIFAEEQMGERCLTIRIVGNAFLHSMVRTIVGTLVEVGAGRRDAGWVADALAACDRSCAGPTAPARGLTFWEVAYA